MKQLNLTVYTFDELSDRAKERAREWYREGDTDFDWFDAVYEDFGNICETLGVDLDTKRGGKSPAIYFSGFWSQGDGACFEGSYAHKAGSTLAIRAYAPKDAELHQIADTLQEVQRRNFYQLHATATHRGHYQHSGCMSVDVERDSPTGQDATPDAEETVRDALRSLADWLYDSLETEHDYLTSDDVVDESIRINEYTFDEEGGVA